MPATQVTPKTVVHLRPSMFSDTETQIAEAPGIVVTGFRYASDVEAVRVRTNRVEVIVLPFRGQQIWRYAVDGEDLTMITRFDEPVRSTNFGETYGAFLVHCGLSGLGAPSRDDTHAHHGELPNAAYDKASLCFGDDWVTVTGDCRIRVSHSTDVSFSPSLTVHSSGTQLEMSVSITNHRRLPFGYSYLCHVNWPIFDGGRLVQTASLDSRHFELVPHQAQDDATTRYTSAIHHDPATGNQMDLGQPIVPEYCAIVRPHSDEAGEAHFAMTRPDGAAAAVSFPVDDLPYAIRWISNTGDEQAAGFCLPSTAHHLGRAAAERDGLIRYVPGGENVTISLKFGLLTGAEAAAMVDVIESASSNYSE